MVRGEVIYLYSMYLVFGVWWRVFGGECGSVEIGRVKKV